MNDPSPKTQMTIDLGGIFLLQRLRALRPEVVAELATSMQDRGQLAPIIVRPREGGGYWLVAGLHRLEAAKLLEWKGIQAVVLEDIAADQAELAEIDENLIRADLSPAERAQHVSARKAYYEKLHPETKHGGAPGKAGGGKAKGANLASFVGATSRATRQSKRTVKRDATRAKKVVVIDQIVGTSLDSGAELDALAKLPEAEQQQLADRATAGEDVSARALKAECADPALATKQPEKDKLAVLQVTWDATPRAMRQQFAVTNAIELKALIADHHKAAVVERAIERSQSTVPRPAAPPAPAFFEYPELPAKLDRSKQPTNCVGDLAHDGT
jgi:ParB-like chromosome segregation protein Spo0J